ncbi:hypothetical protein Dimus_031052 [Dionaea muscipula]
MGDLKDKFKGLMKKVNNSFTSSSSGKFQGQGRVLGSSSSSSSSSPGPNNPILNRPSQYPNPIRKPNPNPNSNPILPSVSSTNPDPPPQETPTSLSDSLDNQRSSIPNRQDANGFDPYGSLITTGKRNKNGYSLNVFECPVCNRAFGSEEEVSDHVESCLSNDTGENVGNGAILGSGDTDENRVHTTGELEAGVGAYLSGKPSQGSVEVVLRLLRNIVKEPENAKFRRVRMSNSKIRENVGEVVGGIELLESVGFMLKEDEGEMWAVMDVPSEENLSLLKRSISLLEPEKEEESAPSGLAKVDENVEPVKGNQALDEPLQPKPIDRQIRVFFSTPGNVAAKFKVPESFYNLSPSELKREAEMRKKKIADSQLLIPKSLKEKQAKAARRRYNKTLIRVQFPDGVVLQGIFYPWELTSNLYEFVSSALKQPGMEFELINPVPFKRRVIPCFPDKAAGEKAATLEEEELVPSALIKFKPVETDSLVFTGLRNELLETSELLVSSS